MKLKKSKQEYYLLDKNTKIKKGDWYFDVLTRDIYQAGERAVTMDCFIKIVASTNKECEGLPKLYSNYFFNTIGGLKIGVFFPDEKDSVMGYYDSLVECFDSLSEWFEKQKIIRCKIKEKASDWALKNADKTMETNSALNKGFIAGYLMSLEDANKNKEWEVDVVLNESGPDFLGMPCVGDYKPTIKDGKIYIKNIK